MEQNAKGTRQWWWKNMEQNATRVGRQAPEPYPEPEGTRKWWWNRMPQDYGALLGTRRNQEMMMEQNAKRLGRQAPEPYPEPEGTRKWWWNRMGKLSPIQGTKSLETPSTSKHPFRPKYLNTKVQSARDSPCSWVGWQTARFMRFDFNGQTTRKHETCQESTWQLRQPAAPHPDVGRSLLLHCWCSGNVSLAGHTNSKGHWPKHCIDTNWTKLALWVAHMSEPSLPHSMECWYCPGNLGQL